MKNWKSIGQAAGLGASDAEVERIVAPLERLEAAFRPLIQELTPDLDPAVGFAAEEDE